MPDFSSIGKAKQFSSFLREILLGGQYAVGDRFPSIRELSEQYGINKSTVNSVIAGLVTEGFLRIEQGRGAFVARTTEAEGPGGRLVGVVLDKSTRDPNIEYLILSGIQEELQADGYFAVPYGHGDSDESFYSGLEKLAQLGVDGFVVLPPLAEAYSAERVRALIGSRPAAFINRNIPMENSDYVYMDFEYGIGQAVRHLFSRGRRRIILARSKGSTLSFMMERGYRAAHDELGLKADERLICLPEEEIAGALGQADAIIDYDMQIFALRDAIAAAGLRIPQDIACVGINDSGYARMMAPPLTSLRVFGEELGRKAAGLLLSRMQKGREGSVAVGVRPELIIREST